MIRVQHEIGQGFFLIRNGIPLVVNMRVLTRVGARDDVYLALDVAQELLGFEDEKLRL